MATRQYLLLGRIATVLRADTGAGSLVTLTGHSTSDIRIARDKPPVKGKLPYLGFIIFDSAPLMGPDLTHLQRSIVRFKCYSSDDLKSIQIADRLEDLFNVSDPISYYDFSDSGSGISTRMTRFRRRYEIEHDNDLDVWNTMIDVNFTWIDSTCQ